jgi:uncharacterized membrane protein YphA (DoxX/SURF4 family)
MKCFSWILQVAAAVILLQTLYFKFTGAEESVAIFTALGMEPHGRYLIGILELIASVLLLVPATIPYGAILGFGLMSGALIGHLTKLGFSGPNLSLSLLALFVWLACIAILVLRRGDVPFVRHMFEKEPEKEMEP